MLSIIDAKYQDDYKIVVEFNDHKKGVVDLKDFISVVMYPLNKTLFKTIIFTCACSPGRLLCCSGCSVPPLALPLALPLARPDI